MLVKFFRHGNTKNATGGRSGGGGAVRDYLLKDKHDKSQPRTGATIFRGDPEITTEIINGIKNSSIYTSGVLSFSPDEQPSDQQLNEIVDSFENTLFPNLDKDQYSSYWVMHQDKGRTELHFVFANIELITQKSLPVYYHKKDLDLIDNWKDITNYEYGLIDPNSPDRKRDLVLSQINFDDQTDDQLKDEIHDEIFNEVTQNKNIKSRADIVNLFKSKGYEVTRQGKKENSISIKHPHQKDNPDKKLRNLKFKGELYSPTFNRDQLNKDVKFYNSKRDQRIQNKRQSFEIELENRRKRLETKFSKIDRTPLDNELTSDLKAINSNLADMADWQRQTLKQIIAESLESVSSEQSNELQQILFDSIDSQIKGEPLPEFDQIIQNYQNQLELAQQQVEQQRLEQQQFEQDRLDRLDLLASFDKFTLDETGIDELESMDYQALLDLKTEYEEWLQSVDDYAQHSDIEPYLNNYQYYRATLNYLHDSNLIEQKRIEAERPIDPIVLQRGELDELKHGYVSKVSLHTYQTASVSVLEKIKQDMLDRIKLLDDKAEHELLTDKEKSSYGNAHRVMNTIDDILSKRELEPVIEPEIVKSDDKEVVQLTPDYDPEPTPEPQPRPEIANNQNGRYIGAVVKIDQNGLYQQVSDKIILHPRYANSTGFKIGEWIDFQYKDGKVQAFDGSSYDMSRFKTSDPDKTKTQDQNQGR